MIQASDKTFHYDYEMMEELIARVIKNKYGSHHFGLFHLVSVSSSNNRGCGQNMSCLAQYGSSVFCCY